VLERWSGTAWVPISPGAELFYAEITANKTINATNVAFPDIVVEGVATTYDGSPVIAEFYTAFASSPNVSSGAVIINLYDAATDLGYIGYLRGAPVTGTPNIGAPIYARRRLVPSAGSHTYRAGAWVTPSGPGGINAGTGTGGFAPCYLRITKA